jgi:hypothetical protein
MASKPSTTTSRTGNTIFSFLLMISLVSVLFLFAAGFHFTDKLYWISSYFFQKIRQLFTFSPLSLPSNEPTYSRVNSTPDLEIGLILEEDNTKIENFESNDEGEMENEEENQTDSMNRFIEEDSEQDLEIQIIDSIPQPKKLDEIIEKSNDFSKDSKNPKSTYEEWQEPIPIDEEDVSEDINGWCFIGQSKGARSCTPVGKMDKCVTGEIYASQMECLQIHPDDAVMLPSLL